MAIGYSNVGECVCHIRILVAPIWNVLLSIHKLGYMVYSNRTRCRNVIYPNFAEGN